MIQYEKNYKEEEPASKEQTQQNFNPYGYYGYPPPPFY